MTVEHVDGYERTKFNVWFHDIYGNLQFKKVPSFPERARQWSKMPLPVEPVWPYQRRGPECLPCSAQRLSIGGWSFCCRERALYSHHFTRVRVLDLGLSCKKEGGDLARAGWLGGAEESERSGRGLQVTSGWHQRRLGDR